MRIVPINEAEAIIEPFWDGGSSEHPGDKYCVLGAYSVTVAPSARAQVVQTWASVEVSIDRAAPGASALRMERACDLQVDGYDVFRVFGSLPSAVRMTVRAAEIGIPPGSRLFDIWSRHDPGVFADPLRVTPGANDVLFVRYNAATGCHPAAKREH